MTQFRRAHYRVVLFSVLLASAMAPLTGCGTLAASRAETFEQKGAALLGDFTLYQRASVKIGEDPTVSNEIRRAVLQAVIAAKPVADKGDTLLREYRSVRAQLATGTTTDEKVAIAAANLQGWISEITPLIRSLRTSVEAVPIPPSDHDVAGDTQP